MRTGTPCFDDLGKSMEIRLTSLATAASFHRSLSCLPASLTPAFTISASGHTRRLLLLLSKGSASSPQPTHYC